MKGDRLLWIVLGVLAVGLILLLASGDSGTVFGFEDEAFARTLYLGVLGAVIAAGIVGSGIRLSHAVRTGAIWLLIILLLMGGYQYRYELQDIASRVTAGLIPGSPLSVSDADGRAAVMLDRLSNGHFEVRAQIDGTPVMTMVDTGATSTVLTYDDASRAGYEPDTLSFTIPIMTANGEARAARVVADEIRIGDIVRNRVPVMVAERGRLDRSLLGMNFIGTLSGFDMRGERLILRD
ncbi:MAG: TIGR02281 family clan AA aspartic protease [Neoaquamicrobium sediminum]|uniref:TIGR02281 family clan AA aspartic protease n=1 Tax=Neoaquamicrobium sediminum TaxID=1849104 RepID=UPI001566A333|nr:TIGR02281 family clan AA aspartic protease [Mesorhizobium sediminum]NRC55381.1 TIGR02281 family clan AA aspartic protease [Mesorhizobium sediminum]